MSPCWFMGVCDSPEDKESLCVKMSERAVFVKGIFRASSRINKRCLGMGILWF